MVLIFLNLALSYHRKGSMGIVNVLYRLSPQMLGKAMFLGVFAEAGGAGLVGIIGARINGSHSHNVLEATGNWKSQTPGTIY